MKGKTKARFFRKFDWKVAGITGFLVFVGYLYTLAPNVTLEDSGELSVASFYAGVPHPPGYPIWTIYTWLFTVLIPISNIAFRVALASAFAGACSCALLALMVSRGSSMIIDGIDALKDIGENSKKTITGISGWVSGMLFGFNGFMWSQAVIVEVYTLSVFSLMGVFVCLMRWMYVPNERRYLYWALFLFGICFNNHQSLVVAAIGIEIGIAAANPRLGRDLFLGNSIVYILGLIAKLNGAITAFDTNLPLFIIYNFVGFCSIASFIWLSYQTREILTEWKSVICMLFVWLAGLSFYLYMPITSSTNPPMNWGYPRTWDGFIHAFTRGQYERTNPTTSLIRFIQQMWIYIKGASNEFNPIMLSIALVPFGFFKQMRHREKVWMTGLVAIFFCLAVVLMILLNPSPDRQSQELNRVFFTPSHILLAIWAGYGVSMILSLLVAHYHHFRLHAILGGSVALGVALYLWAALERVHPLDKFTAIYLIICGVIFLICLENRHKLHLNLALVLFSILPLHSVFSHWWKNEKRGHLYGYWFGHDMFKPPFQIYPEMEKDAVLFGGTDPGRFNPTYMIFCESMISPSKKLDPEFDRRDVYLITQNALADLPYLDYIRAHYNRSAQLDPPFFQEMLRTEDAKKTNRTNTLAEIVAPLDRAMSAFGAKIEARRRANGIYPKKEIYIPSVQDSEDAYIEYVRDAQRRQMINQLKPGEVFSQSSDGHVSIHGQIAVMAINGILARKIFDMNPSNEFYIEESFPLDWMSPHLSPYGIILKLNRQPVPEITEEMMQRDRSFWEQYMERLIGNWITPETSIDELVSFAKDVYLRGDLTKYEGDTKFLREDWAQKAFSKARSAIAGVYAYRISPQCPEALRPKTPQEEQRIFEEADFAFRQAFALCPYSGEVALRYSNLLLSVNRVEDAILLTRTCYEFDLENEGIRQLLTHLNRIKQSMTAIQQTEVEIDQLKRQYALNPTNLEITFSLISKYITLSRTNDALSLLKTIVNDENSSPTAILATAAAFMQLGRYADSEDALARLVILLPNNPEALYDLAATQALLKKDADAISNLAKALKKERQRGTFSDSQSLRKRAQTDLRFDDLRTLPEFHKLMIED